MDQRRQGWSAASVTQDAQHFNNLHIWLDNHTVITGANSHATHYVYTPGDGWTVTYDAGSPIYSLAVYDGGERQALPLLYAGARGKVYFYDGSSWSVESDAGFSRVYAMAVYQDRLYVERGTRASCTWAARASPRRHLRRRARPHLAQLTRRCPPILPRRRRPAHRKRGNGGSTCRTWGQCGGARGRPPPRGSSPTPTTHWAA